MKVNYITMAVALVGLAACNDHDVFEREQYKNVFAFICNSENINQKMVHLDNDETTNYVAFSVGGSQPIARQAKINVVEDPTLIDTYNRNTFDLSVGKYAKPLPKANYTIASLQCILNPGDVHGVIPITIRPAGLSPDTTYFIPLRVDSYDAYELNPQKDHILYRIMTKNRWAKSDASSVYTMRSKRKEVGGTTEIAMPGTKIMMPLSKTTVRIMAGNEAYAASMGTFNRAAMILEIAEDGRVTIRPFRDLDVKQIDGDAEFPNKFFYESDGYNTYKTFLLYYTYRIDKTTYEVKEELRLQYNKDAEKEEDGK